MLIDQLHQLSPGEHRGLIDGPAGRIEAIIHIPANRPLSEIPAFVICCHPHPLYMGAMTNKVIHMVAKAMTSLGLVALRFNFRGVGKSDGVYDDGMAETEDVIFLAQQLQAQLPKAALWLAGFSFGAFVSARAASQVDCQELLSVAPPVGRFDYDQLTIPDCPWLVVMGEADEVVAPDAVFDYCDLHPRHIELIRFAETGHFFHGRLVQLKDCLTDHYQSRLP